MQSFSQFVFMLCQAECYQNTLKLSYKPLAFTSHNATKKSQEKVPLPDLLYGSLRKIFLLLYPISQPNLIDCKPLLRNI